MEILITGNIEYLDKEFYSVLASQHKVVVCGEQAEQWNRKNVTPYQFTMEQEEFEHIFHTFNFDYVVYFSRGLAKDSYRELSYMAHIFSLCKIREKTKLVYVTYSKEVSWAYESTYQIVENATDEMCLHYVQEGNCLLKLSVPFLAAKDKAVGLFEEWLTNIINEKKMKFVYAGGQMVDFLFGSDLAEFLNAYFEEGESGYHSYDLYGGNEIVLQELVAEVEKACNRTNLLDEVRFGELEFVKRKKNEELRYKYGWFPKENIKTCIGDWYNALQSKPKQEKESFRERIRKSEHARFRERMLNLIELILLFVFCEWLTAKTRNMQLLDFADFRLFFVVIAGMMYGLRYGIVASIASCIMYFAGLKGSTNWQIQFYNIINWLPFATYMLAGSIAGYTKDRYKDMVKNSQKSQEVLEDKYVYLNELYTKVLENKESYSNQIVNYRNSFGRIYVATKQLNSVHPSEIFYHAIAVLEDMLDTQEVAIYSLDGGYFARLNACSRRLMNTLTKSLRLEDMPECVKCVEMGETWVNKERLEGYPDYAYGIFKENVLVGLIVIQSSEYSQMSMEYLNRFNIIAGLISDSLVRATSYQELSEKEMMIDGTKIMKQEHFAKEIEAQQLLKENNRANYILLRVITKETDYQMISNQLQRVTRKNDILGIGEDGKVYILLSQADKSNMSAINQRMEQGGVTVEKVSHIG